MANLKMKLPSGAELEVTMGSLKECDELLATVLGLSGEVDINASVLSSKAVRDALWLCLGRALYGGQKIEKSMFEAEERRQDYIPMMLAVLNYNIAPFFAGLGSKSLKVPEKAV